MVDRLEITIVETKRFVFDCALYGLLETEKKRLIGILSGDPAIGVIYDENAALWIWNFAACDFFYAIRDDISKLVLVELRPHSEARVKLIKRLFDVVEKINAFKRLFGF